MAGAEQANSEVLIFEKIAKFCSKIFSFLPHTMAG
jgi:hypothetical protein